MISYSAPLAIGNAIRLILAPAVGATQWRLLRKTVNTFTGETDPAAAVIYDGSQTTSLVDTQTLINGTTYYYTSFELVSGVWQATAIVSVTPATTYGLGGPDPLSVVRDRLESGLKAAVAAGVLSHDSGAIPVYTAPPLFEETRWPIVSVHLQSDAPGQRALGEDMAEDVFDAASGDWLESEGWLSQVRIQIIGWCLNPDTRIALRQVIKNVIIGNLPVFDSFGMVLVTLSQNDMEDFENYSAPVYQVMGDFGCMAPSVLSETVGPVSGVTVEAVAS